MNGNDRRGPVELMSPRREPFMGPLVLAKSLRARAARSCARTRTNSHALTNRARASHSLVNERARGRFSARQQRCTSTRERRTHVGHQRRAKSHVRSSVAGLLCMQLLLSRVAACAHTRWIAKG